MLFIAYQRKTVMSKACKNMEEEEHHMNNCLTILTGDEYQELAPSFSIKAMTEREKKTQDHGAKNPEETHTILSL